jgi:hypothetical protein
MLLPLALCWHVGARSAAWRERLVAATRLYLVAFINLVSLCTYKVGRSRGRWRRRWQPSRTASSAVRRPARRGGRGGAGLLRVVQRG